MTYIENIFLCMVSPLLVAALCMGRRQLRFFLFCIAGMGVSLLSAYINTFLAAVCQADALAGPGGLGFGFDRQNQGQGFAAHIGNGGGDRAGGGGNDEVAAAGVLSAGV